MEFWNRFAAKHPETAKWVREGGLFVIVSNLITVFKYLLLQFLCDKQCQKDFLEHLCSFSVKAKGASAKADAPLCVSCAFCKRADYLPLLFRRGMVSVFVSLQTVQV